MDVVPVVLEGEHVRLEPLSLERHFAALCEVGLDAELWRWTSAQVRSAEDLKRYLQTALAEQEQGTALPFATVVRSLDRAVGSTRFGSIERGQRRVEIGWTWIGTPWQRTAVNTEAKLLMLTHAFEHWGCRRVELKTDALNQRSCAAIRRIGGQEEGTLRKHLVTEAGRVRDTVYFSLLDDEWPAARSRLEERLAAGAGSRTGARPPG
ncbi:MAG TPA: GNAT family protein [Candidatus Limnocylindria bacterium]|nr:GNAT family protein [Candidatus Limnocylindria bacterium]